MTKTTTYRAACLTLLVVAVALGGCLPPHEAPEFHARIDPQRGHVPYEARIVCTPLIGTYRYELPDGSIVSSTVNELPVVVDALTWKAKVTWTGGETVRVDTVTAEGTNARPRILAPRINGNPELWYLEPRERTLIDFTHYDYSMSGPETGVAYDGEWRVVEIRVECPLKTICQAIVPDSIFCPPYVRNTYHALFNGRAYENACIVYPTYTGEIAPNGLPYAPSPEEGYAYDGVRPRSLYRDVWFPEETARIYVTVEDNWQRRTSASFKIPVGPLVWKNEIPPGHPAYVPPPYPDDAVIFVAAKNSSVYHRSTCPKVYAIPVRDRIYFAEQRNADESGRTPCADCF